MSNINFDGERFGRKVKACRIFQKLTLRQAGEELDISPATLSRIENGGLPEVLTFYKLCKWVGTIMNFYIIDSGKVEITHTMHSTSFKNG